MKTSLNLLIVEDDQSVAQYIETLLESFMEGTITIVASGQEAIECTNKNKPDLILMDIVLKGHLDGIQTAHLIHKTHDIPIVYLTSYNNEEFFNRAKITDPFGYMLKPVELRELQAVVTIAINQHENKRILKHTSYVTKSLQKIYHPLIVTDKNGFVQSINDAASKLFGFIEENIQSKSCDTFLKVLIHNNALNFKEEIEKAKQNKGSHKEEEAVTLLLPNGGIIPISITFSLVKNEMNELCGVCIMIVDLTQQTVEKNLLHKKQLEASELFIKERYLKEILDIGKDINKKFAYSISIKERLEFVVNRIVQFSNFEIAHIALDISGKLTTAAISKNGSLYLHHPEEIPQSDQFLKRLYTCFQQQKIDLWEKTEEVFPTLFNEHIKNISINSILMLPLYSVQSYHSLGVISIANSGDFDIETINYFEEFAHDISLALILQKHQEEIEKLKLQRENNYEQTIFSFVQMIEERDVYTKGHSQRVAKYSKVIAKEMGFDESTCNNIYRAGILHDIGKIQTPDKILLNPDSLSKDEYKMVQEHVNSGVRMLEHIEMYQDISKIIEQHHERYDGKGYPKGLKQNEILKMARIMSIADAFDAMTSNRIFRKRFSVTQAFKELQKEAGGQFDPDIVEVALVALSSFNMPIVKETGASEIEHERMAYFFSDNLTHLFSEEYFYYYMNTFKEEIKTEYLCICSISGLKGYNKQYGWPKGSAKIKKTAETLVNTIGTNGTLYFRIYGNKFIIISRTVVDFELIKKALEKIYIGTKLLGKIKCFDIQSLQKEDGTVDIEQIVHQLTC